MATAKRTGTQTSRAARKELAALVKKREKLAARLLEFDTENDARIDRLESIVKQEEGAL